MQLACIACPGSFISRDSFLRSRFNTHIVFIGVQWIPENTKVHKAFNTNEVCNYCVIFNAPLI